ncbi:hypothetical protein HDR59_02270 [bacterium]|nr:hypothetical protein [bacterium]
MKKLFLVMFSLLSIGAKAKEFPRYTENQKAAVNRCRTLDTSILKDLKGAMVAQGVIGGVSGLANVGSLAMNLGTNLSGTDNNKTNLASAIMTGAGTVGSTTDTIISGVQLSKIKSLIEDVEACQEGLANIPDDAEATIIKSDNDTYLKE